MAHENQRVAKLKALGNAIVPAVAYELMLMILAIDDEMEKGGSPAQTEQRRPEWRAGAVIATEKESRP